MPHYKALEVSLAVKNLLLIQASRISFFPSTPHPLGPLLIQKVHLHVCESSIEMQDGGHVHLERRVPDHFVLQGLTR